MKPFLNLRHVRLTNRPELPPDLATFYERCEGVGLSSSSDYPIRLCKLDEVIEVGATDVRLFMIGDGPPDDWKAFSSFHIGVGAYFEDIYYVLDAPCCSPGSILAIGGTLPGPGGEGPYVLEPSLVLATCFTAWLTHLERWDWIEYAFIGFGNLPEPQQHELMGYYLALNPFMN